MAVDVKTLDYSYLGQPWCKVPAKASISTENLDYSYLGQPWAVMDLPTAGGVPTLMDYYRRMRVR